MQSLSRPAYFIVLAMQAIAAGPLESPYITGTEDEYDPSYALLDTESKRRSYPGWRWLTPPLSFAILRLTQVRARAGLALTAR